MLREAIRLLIVSVTLGGIGTWGGTGTALAQEARTMASAMASAPAPRLVFTDQDLQLARLVASDPELAAFYGANGLQPIFLGADAAARREALIAAISDAPAHGLPPMRYGLDLLNGLDQKGATQPQDELIFARAFARWTRDVGAGMLDPRRIDPNNQRQVLRRPTDGLLRDFWAASDPAAILAAVPPQDPRYRILQDALHEGTGLIAPSDLPPIPAGVWRQGDDAPAIAHLRARLNGVGLTSGGAGVPDSLFEASLMQALLAYQTQSGLVADGVAGPQTVTMLNRREATARPEILLSLERMRWLAGHDLGRRHVWVNLPRFNAEIHENGSRLFETRVVIGKEGDRYRTPEFSDEIEYLVVNPRWNVPRSITVRDYLPRLQANRHAVSHLDVVDAKGNIVPRDRIDFRRYTASNFPYRMRQRSGDDNALGKVKFMFPNQWNIYLHDTPTKHLFNQSSRAYSHGCIRIGDPFDLAYHLLRDTASDPQAHFQRALDSKRETWLHLKQDVPVHLVYFTTFPDETGKIRHYRDIYHRDALVLAAFERAALEVFPWDR